MLPTLHHGVSINPSRLDYQQIDNRSNNLNVQNNDQSESRLNKSRLLDYGNVNAGNNGNAGNANGGTTSNYSNEHSQQSKNQNKYGSENYSHLPHIRQND